VTTVKSEIRRFHVVTLSASVVSAILWISAGSIAVWTRQFTSYTIVAILAFVASFVALNSARKEGIVEGEARGIFRERSKAYSEAEE